MTNITINGVTREMNSTEQADYDKRQKEWNDESDNRKLAQIKEIRLEKLIETDYLANSDVTMPDNIKTWRQSLRDIPQDYSADKYDELLARETDKTKANFGELTHSVWSKS
jgi:hypothetical protein